MYFACTLFTDILFIKSSRKTRQIFLKHPIVVIWCVRRPCVTCGPVFFRFCNVQNYHGNLVFFFWKYHWKIIEIFRGLSVGTLIRWCAACNDVWALVRELMGVPMQPTPQMILHEWYHFVQGTLRNHISDITRKNWDSLLISAIFQNGRLKIWDFQYLGNYFM